MDVLYIPQLDEIGTGGEGEPTRGLSPMASRRCVPTRNPANPHHGNRENDGRK